MSVLVDEWPDERRGGEAGLSSMYVCMYVWVNGAGGWMGEGE